MEFVLSFDKSLAYIPLFALAALSAAIFVLLLIVKKRKTARVSFISFISVFILFAGSITAGIRSSASEDYVLIMMLSVIAAAVLELPYLLVLITFEPQKFDKLVPKFVNRRAQLASQAAEVQQQAVEKQKTELTEDDKKFLNISRNFLEQATHTYSDENGSSVLLDYISKTIRDEVKADGSAILMVDDFDDVITVKSFEGDFPPPYKLPSDMPHKPVRVATNFKFASFPLRDNLFGEIASSGKPELITKPEMDDRIYQNGPEEFLECGSYIVAPMKSGDSVMGLIALSRNHSSPKFTEEDFNLVKTLSGFAAAAVSNMIVVKDVIEHNGVTKETDIAINIQTMLRPAKLPVITGTQIGSFFEQNEGVCGDFYDIIPSRKDRVSFIVGDIAGKGINSIIIMTMVRAMLRLVVNTKQTAGTILDWVNKGICGESFSADHFGSCALVNYDPTAQKIEYSTGGTTPVYYYDSAADKIEQISENSEPIGVEKTTEYKNYIHDVKKGDIIVMYTDGIVEALNEDGQQYSKESLLNVIRKNHNSSGKDIANLVKADVKKFSGSVGQHDDQTLLIIKF